MARKMTKNNKYIKAYFDVDKNCRKRIRTRIDNYLKSADISQDKLAEQLTELTGVVYDRKGASGLMTYLKYPKKDRNLVNRAKQLAGEKKGTKTASANLDRLLTNMKENKTTKTEFKKAWTTLSFNEINQKYGFSQHDCYILANHFNLGKKPNKQYAFTYKDLYAELLKHGETDESLRIAYMDNLTPAQDLIQQYENLIGREVTAKRLTKMMEMLGYKRTRDDVKYIQGVRSREKKAEAMTRLKQCGYTLDELAQRYENDLTLTKRRLINELNSCLDIEDTKFTDRWLQRHLDPLLTKTRLGSVSRSELDFRNELSKLIPNEIMETSVRTLISPYEVDIYLPKLKTAIEFNGDYWHSDKFLKENHGMSAETYHKMKHAKCRKKGIKLLFVWESDWNERDNEVLDSLSTYLTTGKIPSLLSKMG